MSGSVGDSAGTDLATGDGWQDRQLAPVGNRCVEAVLEADVLAAYVDVDETTQLAVVGDPRPQVLVLREERVEGLPHRAAFDLDLGVAADDCSQLGWNLDRDRHLDRHRLLHPGLEGG